MWVILCFHMICSVHAAEKWRTWKSGKLLQILVEEQLYTSPAHDLSIHVAVKNISQHPIGIDPNFSITINQWTGTNESRRTCVDERRIPFKVMSQQEAIRLTGHFKSGQLQALGPGQSRQFVVRFNGTAGASEVDKCGKKFLILSLDGQIRCSDGVSSESVGRLDSEFIETDVSFPLPVQWVFDR